MVCPNCKSKDIVELQGQHFCINCGRLIELITKKRGPGRPKAQRMDRPKAVTLQVAAKPLAALDAPTSSAAVSEPAADTALDDTDKDSVDSDDKATEAVPAAKIIHGFQASATKPAPEVVARQAEVTARKRLQDIVPSSPAVPMPAELSPQAGGRSAALALSPIVAAAWAEPWQGGPARILVTAAVIAAIAAGFAAYAGLSHGLAAIGLLQSLGLTGLLIALTLLFGVSNTERAASALRRYDHRPIPRSWLFGGALAVLGRQTTVVVAGVIDGAIVIAIAYFAGRAIPQLLPIFYATPVLISLYFVLSIGLLAVWAKTGLASAGVELGQMRSITALKFGWGSLKRHPELIGTRLVAALWLAASLSGIMGLSWLMYLNYSAFDIYIISIAAACVAMAAVLLGNFGAVGWRQAAYRELVIMDESDRAIALLSGHHNGEPKPHVKISFVAVIIILVTIGFVALFTSFYR